MSDQYSSREERRKAMQGNSRSNPSHQKNNKKKKSKNGLFKKVLLSLLILFVIGTVAGGVTFAVLVSDSPSLDEEKMKTPYSSTIYDKNGKEIAEIGSEKRTYVSINDIPDQVKNAFLATEDARFYDHHGIDPIRIGGALVANVTGGFGAEGGSTITQQVVKNSLLSHEKTLKRKVQEVWLSLQLERQYSKDEILEMYLNRIYFSPRAYGVGKAAEEFFGVTDLKDLTVEQAAVLAGMPQSPNNYNPIKNPERAEQRRNVVLGLMEQHGFISKAEYDKAKSVAVTEGLVSEETYAKKTEENKYSAFVEQVVEEVKSKAGVDVGTDGLKIHTTLDPDAQSYMEDMLNGDSLSFTEGMQAGITLLDTKTGEIRAIGAGRNVPAGGYNYATDARRQPGSSIKPILDYGPVIENKKWSTYEQINDEPYSYDDGTPINNFDNSYKGWMTAREALAQSRNIPALKAFQEVGKDKAKEFAGKLGINFNGDVYESYSIGGFGEKDPGVSSLQMAGAYSAFGNNGYYNEPHAVTSVEFNDGTKMDLTPEPEAAMSDYTAFMISDMLQTAVQTGTGRAAQVPGVNIAGKTGTTNFSIEERQKYNISKSGARDSWFVGYSPQYTAAIWTGMGKNDQNKVHLTTSEQQLAKKAFKQLMTHVDDGSGSFEKPDSVVAVDIEKGSNPPVKASEYTPESQRITEYFVKGSAPSQVSTKYEKTNKPENLNVSYDEASKSVTLNWTHEKDDATFQVMQSINDGGYAEIQNSGEKSIVIPNVQPGSVYRFQVTAISGDNRSDTASTMIEIPGEKPPEEKPDGNGEINPPAEQPDNPGGQQPDPNQNGNNGNNGGQNDGNPADGNQGGNTPPEEQPADGNQGGNTPPPEEQPADGNQGGNTPPSEEQPDDGNQTILPGDENSNTGD
ncbi:PBP1A family penicillin-binding protein [Bacillus gobiensis]|uniref:PBP1A family penicillin-binding protein n=1 Tax=Bacillus gobiensis TaxID=1441095 RepID=UPI003D2609BF